MKQHAQQIAQWEDKQLAEMKKAGVQFFELSEQDRETFVKPNAAAIAQQVEQELNKKGYRGTELVKSLTQALAKYEKR